MSKLLVATAVLATLCIGGIAGATDLPYTTPSVNNDITTMQGSGGIYTWTDTTSAVGDWSAELYWPVGGYAQARVFPGVAGVSTVSSINSWSYWANAPASYAPNISFVLDDPDVSNDGPVYSGLGYDTVVTIWPSNSGQGDTWLQFLSGSSLSYTVWTNANPGGGPVMKTMTWDQFKGTWSQSGMTFDFSNADVLRMNLGKGVIGTSQNITAYIDDFTLNGYTYEFEPQLQVPPVPEPMSILLGIMGLGSIAGFRRFRK